MIEKMQGCGLCGVEVSELHQVAGSDKEFCSDECAEAYLNAKLLLPCPFCGVKPSATLYDSHGWSIECENPDCPVMPSTRGFCPSRMGVIQTWNIRTAR